MATCGMSDDNNMNDVMTEIISFASLAPLRLRVKSGTRKTRGCNGAKNKNLLLFCMGISCPVFTVK